MPNVNDRECKELRTALGREIGETKEKAQAAHECAQKKVEKSNFRWTVGIMISVIGSILVVLFWYSVSNGSKVAETKETVAGMKATGDATKEKVDGLERDHREWRTEQRALNKATQDKLDEIRDLVKPR